MKIRNLLLAALATISLSGISQTLYVPSGTSGIGTSTVTGKVGIGTGLSAPTTLLDLGGTNSKGNLLRLRSGDAFNNSLFSYQILFSYYGTANYTHAIKSRHHSAQDAGNALDFYLWDYGTDAASTVGSKLVMTLNAGNVGIGCSNPTEKLVVNGKTVTTELEVRTTPCSDFVFEPNYKLKSIAEVEQFVISNKHLPDVPSANEFKEKGSYNISEMDNLLLQKVEELTLYIIELKKENENLNQKMNTLQSKL
jgi:hypothetical protein